jgi:ATP-dependent protease ClpP protease subunit
MPVKRTKFSLNTDSAAAGIGFFTSPASVSRKILSSQYEFYLSGTIAEPEEYVDWFDTIRNATSEDVVKIFINSRGGDADTALQFMRVLTETEATVICSVEGSCMSAATMVFLCADIYEISPNSLFMFHNYSGGIFGKGGEIYDQAIFERAWSKDFLNHIYKDFLTPSEITSLLDSKARQAEYEAERKALSESDDDDL